MWEPVDKDSFPVFVSKMCPLSYPRGLLFCSEDRSSRCLRNVFTYLTKLHGVTSYKNLTHVPSCLQMENPGYEKDRRSAVEMGEVSSSEPEGPLATVNGNGVPGCTDACLALHQQHQKSLQQYQKSGASRPPDSPWHFLKTVFLVAIVASLIVWVLVYTVLSQLAVV